MTTSNEGAGDSILLSKMKLKAAQSKLIIMPDLDRDNRAPRFSIIQ